MHTAQPVRSRNGTLVDDLTFTLCLGIFAVALVALAGLADPGPSVEASAPAATAPPRGQEPAGAFTGTYVNGSPVYRLPAVTVQASREIEMARIGQEDKPARNPGAIGHRADQG